MKNKKGFTLTELLIAVIIALLIVLIVSTIFVLNQKVLRKSNIKAELTQNARITLDLMAREIRQAEEIVTTLPPNDSDPGLIAHELQFEDGQIDTHIQYIKYYLDNSDLKRQIIIYYFDASCGGPCPPSDPSYYVHWDDTDPFGGPIEEILEDRIIGEYFSNLDFYDPDKINADLILQKQNEQIKIKSIIHPRNI
jgi:prepilin-type N-terminal cleavage/methylation domain-containing protein